VYLAVTAVVLAALHHAVEECSALRSRLPPSDAESSSSESTRNNSCAKVKSGCVIGAPAASLTRCEGELGAYDAMEDKILNCISV